MTDLEKQILGTVQDAIAKTIHDVLANGYDSPLKKLVVTVVNEHADQIQLTMRTAFATVILTDEFQVEIMAAFQHKIAKLLVGQLEGSVEKTVNVLRQDPTIRAKMVLAVEEIVKQNMPIQKQ